MKKTFYSNGKLLITGEYLVLDGAKSLALPTKFGQNLIVEEDNNQEIKWKSYDADGSAWFEETIPFSAITTVTAFENESVTNTLITILREAYLLNPNLILNSEGYSITTHLTFPKKWGLGTSSTLINNIALWFEIDAFLLLKNSFGGSGYDIACAQNDCPIVYHLEDGKPMVEKVNFKPIFSENLYFVYLNQKQSSKNAIEAYQKNSKFKSQIPISSIDEITARIIDTTSLLDFEQALKNHEEIISKIISQPAVKDLLFPDFEGEIKSLGAWGGDFVLVVSQDNPSSYFISKGYGTVISYTDMIL
jgi:mevalonate kinase